MAGSEVYPTMIQTFTSLAEQILHSIPLHQVIAVDGRSASGKTTFAKALAGALNAPLVHTDDVAWHHSFLDWWPLLIDHILMPFKIGEPIEWTPQAWKAKGRSGAIRTKPR
jgi:ABC-type cobalamin/Fe3+-siderophores transport system ATPase subunit